MRTKHYRMLKKSLACALSMAMLAGSADFSNLHVSAADRSKPW